MAAPSGRWSLMAKNSSFSKRFERALESNYSVPPITIIRGKGAYLFDADGKKYLDFLSGIATNALGASHPEVVKAISHQVRKVGHISNFYSNPQSLELAEILQELIGDSSARVFFCNSGAEANEAAMKISRLTGKQKIIAMEGAFHGRTMGALSLTGQESKQRPFRPLLKKVHFVPFGDLQALERKIDRKTAMVIVEPIQGESGVVVPPDGYLKGVEKLCRKHGALFAIDSVQTGLGRCGTWFGWDEEISPDLISLAKSLGGGLPMGALIVRGNAPHFSPGEHGSTFGGNPVVSAAALATLKVIRRRKLLLSSIRLGEKLRNELVQLPGVKFVRGKGLLIGIGLDQSKAKELVQNLVSRGVLVNATSEDLIRIAPPLIIGEREVKLFIREFTASLGEVLDV